MMERLDRSWDLFQKSLHVMRREPKLLVFPALSFLATLSLLALIWMGMTPESLRAMGSAMNGDASGIEEWWMLPAYFVLYLATMTVANFCGAAYYREIMRGLAGMPVSVSGGFFYAASRFKAILLWSLLAATVGLILALIERRVGIVGRIILKIVGMAWAVVTVFAVPVLVTNHSLDNPIEVLKRSAGTIRKTWGEALIGYVGMNILTGVATFLMIVLAIVLFLSLGGTGVGGVLLALLFFAYLAFLYVVAVCNRIYIAAMYRYANGQSTDAFDNSDFVGAFQAKPPLWNR